MPMDRIQSALDRAKAARDQGAPLAQPARSMPTEPAPDHDLQALWEGPDQIRLDEKLLRRHRLLSYFGKREAAAHDLLRTRIIQQMRQNNWRTLAITSPNSSCGKTTTSLNLGFSFSRQPELRTMVIELDMRRPALGRTLGYKRQNEKRQFSRVLDGREPFEQHALRHGSNLIFGFNESPARHPSELLQGQAIVETLKDIETVYDPSIVIFDMPPVMVSDDTIGFVNNVDCALLIAAAESTSVKDVDICERELAEHTNVLGVVLNKCRYMNKESSYSYYD